VFLLFLWRFVYHVKTYLFVPHFQAQALSRQIHTLEVRVQSRDNPRYGGHSDSVAASPLPTTRIMHIDHTPSVIRDWYMWPVSGRSHVACLRPLTCGLSQAALPINCLIPVARLTGTVLHTGSCISWVWSFTVRERRKRPLSVTVIAEHFLSLFSENRMAD
jgi:hypothetical protein